MNGQVIATLAPFVSGGSVIAPRRFSVSRVVGIVERHAPTWINLVPTIIAYLLSAASGAGARRFPSVRFARSASAPLAPEQQRAFERVFGIPVFEAMGMTETASVAFCNPQDPARRKYGSVGLPCGVEAKVVDPASGRALPDGVAGEICLRGPNVMAGYCKESPEQTAQAFDRDGFLRSGDLGYRDADGYYFVTGRLKELIIKGGENIAPREIDEALLRHPAVLEAAAVGVPDPAYGQEIVAFVVPKPHAAPVRRGAARMVHRGTRPLRRRRANSGWSRNSRRGRRGKIQRLKLAEAL
ncbi:MAG: AMP-binding protein [Burkholderiales bacterium]|nr:AMP-binding protein [Burkholderiales bacterium]